jgi:hypothetical protein
VIKPLFARTVAKSVGQLQPIPAKGEKAKSKRFSFIVCKGYASSWQYNGMSIGLLFILATGFVAYGKDSYSKKPILKPVNLQSKPVQQNKELKPIPLVTPGSTYRIKPEPVLKSQSKFQEVEVKPPPLSSEMHKIKSKKLEPIDIKIKKAPSPEPSSAEKKN